MRRPGNGFPKNLWRSDDDGGPDEAMIAAGETRPSKKPKRAALGDQGGAAAATMRPDQDAQILGMAAVQAWAAAAQKAKTAESCGEKSANNLRAGGAVKI